MNDLINQLFNLVFVILIFSMILGVVFYTFSKENRLANSDFNAISHLIILLVISFLLGILYHYLSFPFNSLYLLNGILVHVLFYDRFLNVFVFKKHLAHILIAVLYFGSILLSIIVCSYLNKNNFYYLFTDMPNSLFVYWTSLQSNTNAYLDFLMKLFGLFIAMRGI